MAFLSNVVVLSDLDCSPEESNKPWTAGKLSRASLLPFSYCFGKSEAVNCGEEPEGEAGIAQSWCRVSTPSIPRKNK